MCCRLLSGGETVIFTKKAQRWSSPSFQETVNLSPGEVEDIRSQKNYCPGDMEMSQKGRKSRRNGIACPGVSINLGKPLENGMALYC
jgi:hypothetical protein